MKDKSTAPGTKLEALDEPFGYETSESMKFSLSSSSSDGDDKDEKNLASIKSVS
jgi:hypothetical protein